MKPQRLKDVYFTTVRPIARLSHLAWRSKLRHGIPRELRRGENGQVWLHLGCGTKVHPNFVNIDGNIRYRPDMWLDLRNGLPFPTQSVDRVYACHVFEHFYWDELVGIFRECFRVLQHGGGIRILVPSVELAVQAYLEGDRDWFPEFPTAFDSLGGRFVNFLFCDGQHRLAFDFSFIVEALSMSGFVENRRMAPRLSILFPSYVLEQMEPASHYIKSSLVVEARKLDKSL